MYFPNGKNIMKLVTVRIGNKYGPEYETYLEKKLPDYEFIWVREPIRDDVLLQWNKMYTQFQGKLISLLRSVFVNILNSGPGFTGDGDTAHQLKS